MEDRVLDLEREVSTLRIDNATLSQSVDHLTQSVDKLTDVVQELRDTMNKGRGAVWAVTTAGGVVGAVVVTAFHSFFNK